MVCGNMFQKHGLLRKRLLQHFTGSLIILCRVLGHKHGVCYESTNVHTLHLQGFRALLIIWWHLVVDVTD